jgi:hypothetical protein
MKDTQTEVKKTEIKIDDDTYIYEDMSKDQQLMVNHLADLEQKIGSCQFNLDQLTVGKNAFLGMLKTSLSDTVKV